MKKVKTLLFIVIIISFVISCNYEKPELLNRAVIAISADLETINPIYSFSVDEGVVDETLFLSLVQFEWNDDAGDLDAKPMLATGWEWTSDSSSIIFNLRDDVLWSDGKKFSAEDVVYTFDIYSDPIVQSRYYGAFKNLYKDYEEHIDINKTFEILTPNKIKINFVPGSAPSLLDIVYPIIPKHIYEKLDRKTITTSEINFKPISNGAYKLKKWERNQMIVLEADKKSFLYTEEMIDEIIFKIVPDYNSRITQLKKGEVDFCELVKPADTKDIKNSNHLLIETVRGREYDYIGLSNLDVDKYSTNQTIYPNKYFGSKKIRQAITYAINKQEILSEYLNNYGELAITPVSSIFKSSYDEELKPIDFNIEKAKQLLQEEGWRDINNNGVIEKNGIEFSFTLYIPGGNPLREFAATVIANNLKAIGIQMRLQKLELGEFLENLYTKKMDAWMVSSYIPVPLDLKTVWHSDLEKTPNNFSSYQSEETDKIVEALDMRISEIEKKNLYKKFQKIIYQDCPVVFLYWTDNIIVHNKRLENVTIDPFGALQKLWEWKIQN
jgi:peptide/nickel transport system substrate-binding protein